ncbi:MAG: VWA domain-containing protein [Acidobacteria bacterium]|nr:VWA domain-containing protein [Acidobacteriota bacterium]
MTRHTCRLAFATMLLGAFVTQAGRATYQSASPPQQNPRRQLPPGISDQTYRVAVDLVNIFCSVWDKKTHSFATHLTRDDFIIYEDSRKQEIVNFNRETDLPLTIALLIDTSQSVAPKLKFEQEAATNFFYTVLRERDRAMLVEFDSGVTLVQDFTNNPNLLAKQIKTLKAAGGTALYDAIYLACDEKLIRETGRKAIVLLSDGEDMSSRRSFEHALEMALRAEAIVFSISVNRGGFFGVGTSKEGDKTLEELSERTGGRVFYPFKVEDLEDAFRQISQELRSQYNIGYLSTNAERNGGYRKIEVRVIAKDTNVSFRQGYYAPGM